MAGNLYERAAIVGGPAVYLQAGERFEDDGNERKALEYFRKAADGGCYFGFALAATIYYGDRNYADEARCWRKFVDSYVRDTSPKKAEANTSTAFHSPLRYFSEWYLHGRFHVSGVPMADYASMQIDEGEPLQEWRRYLQRGKPDDSFIAPIAAELLKDLNKEGEDSFIMMLGDATHVRVYLKRLKLNSV